MNNKNLKPLNKRTKSEQREIQRKGGLACAKRRKEKKEIQNLVRDLLNAPLHDGNVDDKITSITGMKGKNISGRMMIVLKQFEKAAKGDTRAAILLLGYDGGDLEFEHKKKLDEKYLEFKERELKNKEDGWY